MTFKNYEEKKRRDKCTQEQTYATLWSRYKCKTYTIDDIYARLGRLDW